MTLRVGDVLEKKRGGGTKRVKVVNIVKDGSGIHASIESLAPVNSKHGRARQWWVALGDDGLPEGYRRAVKS